MFKIFLYIIKNLILSLMSMLIGFLFCLLFYPIYFEKYYCCITYVIILILFFFFVKKNKHIFLLYFINFLTFTVISSYVAYRPFFLTKSEQDEIFSNIRKQCENEPKNTKNIVCISYRLSNKNFNSILDFNFIDFKGFPSRKASERNAKNIQIEQNHTFDYVKKDFNSIKNSNSVADMYVKLIKAEIKAPHSIYKGQKDSHTEVKNRETINTIYNYINNEQRERQNTLKKYENVINFINKK